jgi:hypothetical protein
VKWLAIVALCTAAAIAYGLLHDQVTARICPEYFTIGHAPIGTDSPTLLGLFWGVVATWWVGAGLGIPLATAARLGRPPRLEPRELSRPLLIVIGATAGAATLAGVLGHLSASHGAVRLVGDLAQRVPREKHTAFLTDLWIHNASYGAGALGGLVLFGYTLGRRLERRSARGQAPARSPRSPGS